MRIDDLAIPPPRFMSLFYLSSSRCRITEKATCSPCHLASWTRRVRRARFPLRCLMPVTSSSGACDFYPRQGDSKQRSRGIDMRLDDMHETTAEKDGRWFILGSEREFAEALSHVTTVVATQGLLGLVRSPSYLVQGMSVRETTTFGHFEALVGYSDWMAM